MTAPAKATTVNVAVVQAGSVPFDTEACVDKVVRLIGEAAAKGAKVIVFDLGVRRWFNADCHR